MARHKKNNCSDDDEFILPDPETSSSEEEEEADEEEQQVNTYPALTQGTSDAVTHLLFLAGSHDGEPDHWPVVREVLIDSDDEEHRRLGAIEDQEDEDHDEQTRTAVPKTLTTAASIASALETDNNESLDLDDSELELLSSAANIGKRSKKTEYKIVNLIKRWFSTIQDHGGDILCNLLVMVPADYAEGRTHDYAFFNVLGGEKNLDKTAILNKCCILCGMKWLCLSGKTKGQTLAPISFTKYMSTIFNEFRMRKGMKYDFRTDFNDKGQFHGVMIVNWNRIRQKDPKFGTKQHQAQFDWEADTKIREAIKNGRLKPFKDPVHLQLVTLYVLGRMFLLRGCKEMANLNHHDTYGGVYGREMGELAGNEYEAIQVPESKTNQLSLDNPAALSKKDQVIEIAENPFDIVCPVKLLRFYKDRCHPQAIKFFAKVATDKDRTQYKKDFKGKDIWYKPSEIGKTQNNVGHNKITGFMKRLGGIIGVANVEKFTNHGLRGYAITKMHVARVPLTMRMKFARHSCEKSQIPYARLTNDGFVQAQLALRGVNGTADKVVAKTNADMQQSNKRKLEANKSVSQIEIEDVFDEPSIDPVDEVSVVTVSSKGTSKLDNLSREELLAILKGQKRTQSVSVESTCNPAVQFGEVMNHNIGFPNQHCGFPNQHGGFPNQYSGFPNSFGGFHNHTGGGLSNPVLPNQHCSFPNLNGGFPNQYTGGFPNQQSGFQNPHGGFQNPHGGFQNPHGGFPSQQLFQQNQPIPDTPVVPYPMYSLTPTPYHYWTPGFSGHQTPQQPSMNFGNPPMNLGNPQAQNPQMHVTQQQIQQSSVIFRGGQGDSVGPTAGRYGSIGPNGTFG
jgi:hypothetical protein